MLFSRENEGLFWRHRDKKALTNFLEYRDPINGFVKSFCDAPNGFWEERGRQTLRPLFDGLPVVFYLSASRTLFAIGNVDGNSTFYMVKTIGTSLGEIIIPRSVRCYNKVHSFPEGIWLRDIVYIKKEWPDFLGKPPRGSRILDSERWRRLIDYIRKDGG